MKNLTIILLFLSIQSFAQCNCDKLVKPNGKGQSIDLSKSSPGDTVCLMGGYHGKWMVIENAQGTEDQPIVIINCGGVVSIKGTAANHNGIVFLESNHFQLSGEGYECQYFGVQIENVGFGVVTGSWSTNYEINNVKVTNALNTAFSLKNSPSCDPRTWRINGYENPWLSLHDCKVEGSKNEGIYIGDSHYHTYPPKQPKNCKEMPIGYIQETPIVLAEVYNNEVSNTGADGIQVGSVTGQALIYLNKVEHFGLNNSEQHNSGIQINPGTRAEVYLNEVNKGTGEAFFCLGDGIILRDNRTDSTQAAIAMYDRVISPETKIQVTNNTFTNIYHNAITAQHYNERNKAVLDNSVFFGNIIHIKRDASFSYGWDWGNPSFPEAWMYQENFFTKDINQIKK